MSATKNVANNNNEINVNVSSSNNINEISNNKVFLFDRDKITSKLYETTKSFDSSKWKKPKETEQYFRHWEIPENNNDNNIIENNNNIIENNNNIIENNNNQMWNDTPLHENETAWRETVTAKNYEKPENLRKIESKYLEPKTKNYYLVSNNNNNNNEIESNLNNFHNSKYEHITSKLLLPTVAYKNYTKNKFDNNNNNRSISPNKNNNNNNNNNEETNNNNFISVINNNKYNHVTSKLNQLTKATIEGQYKWNNNNNNNNDNKDECITELEMKWNKSTTLLHKKTIITTTNSTDSVVGGLDSSHLPVFKNNNIYDYVKSDILKPTTSSIVSQWNINNNTTTTTSNNNNNNNEISSPENANKNNNSNGRSKSPHSQIKKINNNSTKVRNLTPSKRIDLYPSPSNITTTTTTTIESSSSTSTINCTSSPKRTNVIISIDQLLNKNNMKNSNSDLQQNDINNNIISIINNNINENENDKIITNNNNNNNNNNEISIDYLLGIGPDEISIDMNHNDNSNFNMKELTIDNNKSNTNITEIKSQVRFNSPTKLRIPNVIPSMINNNNNNNNNILPESGPTPPINLSISPTRLRIPSTVTSITPSSTIKLTKTIIHNNSITPNKLNIKEKEKDIQIEKNDNINIKNYNNPYDHIKSRLHESTTSTIISQKSKVIVTNNIPSVMSSNIHSPHISNINSQSINKESLTPKSIIHSKKYDNVSSKLYSPTTSYVASIRKKSMHTPNPPVNITPTNINKHICKIPISSSSSLWKSPLLNNNNNNNSNNNLFETNININNHLLTELHNDIVNICEIKKEEIEKEKIEKEEIEKKEIKEDINDNNTNIMIIDELNITNIPELEVWEIKSNINDINLQNYDRTHLQILQQLNSNEISNLSDLLGNTDNSIFDIRGYEEIIDNNTNKKSDPLHLQELEHLNNIEVHNLADILGNTDSTIFELRGYDNEIIEDNNTNDITINNNIEINIENKIVINEINESIKSELDDIINKIEIMDDNNNKDDQIKSAIIMEINDIIIKSDNIINNIEVIDNNNNNNNNNIIPIILDNQITNIIENNKLTLLDHDKLRQGFMVKKKLGSEKSYQIRFIWLDYSTGLFYWSKSKKKNSISTAKSISIKGDNVLSVKQGKWNNDEASLSIMMSPKVLFFGSTKNITGNIDSSIDISFIPSLTELPIDNKNLSQDIIKVMHNNAQLLYDAIQELL